MPQATAQGEPARRFNVAMYRDETGPRAAVLHESGVLVDVARAAGSAADRYRELRPFQHLTDLQAMLNADADLDALVTLKAMAVEQLPDSAIVPVPATFEAPILRPGKVIGVGLNVPGLVGGAVPPVDELPSVAPFWFMKASTAVTGHGQPIIHPGAGHSNKVIPEPELAMIIGKRCGPGIASPKAEEAARFIAGWSICNDVSALDIEFERGGAPFAYNLTWSKSYPTFSPIGPWLTRMPAAEATRLDVSLEVNGETICSYNTADMLWNPFELLEYFAAVVTLEPGDVISCGNAPPVSIVSPGDRVDIDISSIGRLTNGVIAAQSETTYRIPEKASASALEHARRRLQPTR